MSFESPFSGGAGAAYSSGGISPQTLSSSQPHLSSPPSNTFSPSGIMFSSPVTGTWISILGLLGLASVVVAADKPGNQFKQKHFLTFAFNENTSEFS